TCAPTPARCAAAAASASQITPTAAFVARLSSSARTIPIVFESPPTPGLSCVSAMTTGFAADELGKQRVGRAIGGCLAEGIRPDRRPAFRKIGGGKTRRERQRHNRVVFERRQ